MMIKWPSNFSLERGKTEHFKSNYYFIWAGKNSNMTSSWRHISTCNSIINKAMDFFENSCEKHEERLPDHRFNLWAQNSILGIVRYWKTERSNFLVKWKSHIYLRPSIQLVCFLFIYSLQYSNDMKLSQYKSYIKLTSFFLCNEFVPEICFKIEKCYFTEPFVTGRKWNVNKTFRKRLGRKFYMLWYPVGITYSKLPTETLEQGVKHVES